MPATDSRAPATGATSVRRIEGDALYLTFDDGPDPHWTPRVLDVLAHAGAHATFFVVGASAARFGAVLRDVHRAGHAVGNHGWSHRHPWQLDRRAAEREVRDGADAIMQVLGTRVTWFRPAHGRVTVPLQAATRAGGQRIALWSLSAIDWGPAGTRARIESRLAAARAGDIVLLHDGPRLQNRPAAMLAALPAALARMQRGSWALLPLPDATLAA